MQVDYETEMFESPTIPERRLLAAVLARALTDLHSNIPLVARNALCWFITKNSVKFVRKHLGFTFTQIMEELNFSAEQIAIIQYEIKKAFYGKCMPKREESGTRFSKLAERKQLYVRKKKCSALRLTY